MFSWGRRPSPQQPTPPPPPPPPMNQTIVSSFLRNDHLQSYIGDATLGPSTRRVSQDDTTYDTVFQTRTGDALILRVHFPVPTATRPSIPPVMTLVGVRATHPWIDSSMRVTGYSPINSAESWATSNLKLGAAVNSVVRHLQLEPPNVIQITDPSLQRLQDSLRPTPQRQSSSSHTAASATQTQQSTSHPPSASSPPDYENVNFHIPIPPVPTAFPELNDLSSRELHNLLHDDKLLCQNIVEKMSSVNTLKDLMNSIFTGNVETAQSHLQRQEEVEGLHAEVLALKNDLKEKVDVYKNLQQQVDPSFSDDNVAIIQKLTKAKKAAFHESEEIASEWIDSGDSSTIDEFVKEFLQKRIVHHTRGAKIERLQHVQR